MLMICVHACVCVCVLVYFNLIYSLDDLNIDSTPITKTIITGMNKQIKTIHKEELGVSETERKIKRKVENKLQQMATASSAESAKFGRKTSPSPSTTDLSSTTPPNKVNTNALEGGNRYFIYLFY